ncbi:enolase [Thermogymnomonas acidicola]|uniref:Enolase n=1 Tax=Thermogymnomonas acidicola TaxID=399579 RepID=A0AA37BRJ0_9ARCH|nr:enolase C-terminal domain-like protein [Thermogymnomonas acidicola]GGM73860.1 enolase [Thermogymnomonas acidicola]
MPSLPIEQARLRKILDSRGNLTVEAELVSGKVRATASAPSGASTGETEVVAFSKSGIDEAFDFFNRRVKNYILGFNALDQRGFDSLLHEIDGTENFSNMGGNVSTALSICAAKLASSYLGIPLYRYVGGTAYGRPPSPLGNVIGGGKHTRNGTTIQEFLVSAQGGSTLESMITNAMVHRRVGEKLSQELPGCSVGLGDEKAWTASITDEKAMEILRESVDEVSKERGVRILTGTDLAASEFFDGKHYVYRDRKLSRDEQIDFAVSLAREYGFYYIEDPMDERDFEGFAEITKKVGGSALVVGDDLYTTNPRRIAEGIEKKATNGVLIKVNQIGTLSDTVESVKLATRAGMLNTISHRSGETTDDFIAHLGVAFSSRFIKSGTIGGERLAKLNELIRIEEELSTD